MDISLKPEHEQFIQAQLETGSYTSVDEIVNEALDLFVERERRLVELRQKVAMGNEQIDNGQVTAGETVFAQLQAKINSYE